MKAVQSLERGIHILFQFTKERPFLTTDEIAQAVNLPKSSVYRFLATLKKLGVVERQPLTGRYALGLNVLALAAAVHSSIDLESIARPLLAKLGEFSGETVQLNLRDADQGICLYGVESPSAFRLAPERGKIIPLHAGASGLSILAFMEPAAQARICAGPLARFTPDTITAPEKLHALLAEIRQQGYVITAQQVYLGSLGIAAPVFGKNRQVLGSVSVSAPIPRITEPQKNILKDEIVRVAQELTDKMALLEH